MSTTQPRVRIAAVIAKHETGPTGEDAPFAIQCACGEVFASWERADLHVADMIVSDLELREERGGYGDSTYDPAVWRLVSAYNRDPSPSLT